MRRITALLLAALLALGLTACQDEKSVSGTLAEVQTDGEGNLSALVLEQDGKRTGVLLAKGTSFWPMGEGSWSGEEALAAFRKDLQPGNEFRAWCYSRKEKLETAEGEAIPAYWAQSVSIEGILERNALTLRDGTAIDSLERDGRGSRTYRLPDGTELLRVDKPFGPENVHVMSLESFDDLSEAAKQRVRDWYEARGPLYDEAEELEKSYAAYQELGEEFEGGWVRQDTAPCASNERVMYFVTILTLPQEHGGRLSYEIQFGAAFDRETGEKYSNWDLFAVPEAEVRRRLPELVDWEIPRNVRTAMTEALEPEWILFGRESLSITFPAGSLPGEELDYIIGVDYQNAPEGFFQPWAVPAGREE